MSSEKITPMSNTLTLSAMGIFFCLRVQAAGVMYVDAASGYDAEERGSRSDPVATIQYAIDRIEEYGVVVVRPGLYGPVTITNKPLTLLSSGTASATVINASGGSAVYIGTNVSQVVVSGFTIVGGAGTENESGWRMGGGICCRSPLTLRHCALKGSCGWSLKGGGIAVLGPIAVIVENCLFFGNQADEGSAIYADGAYEGRAALAVRQSTLTDNSGGACVSVGSYVDVTFVDTILWNNGSAAINEFGYDSPIAISYSCVQDASSSLVGSDISLGEGVMTDNPCFANDWYRSGLADYELRDYSSCCGAGAPNADGVRGDIGHAMSRYVQMTGNEHDYAYYLTDDGAVVTNVAATVSGGVIFPQFLDGNLVVGIENADYWGTNVFMCLTNIVSVALQDGLQFIGNDAFTDRNIWWFDSIENSRLEAVWFPSSLRRIGYRAFMGNEQLRDVKIPESVMEIGESAFSSCKSARFDVSPNNEFFSSDSAGGLFDKDRRQLIRAPGVEYLWNWYLPESLECIKEFAFSGISPQDHMFVEIPKGVTNIEELAFGRCQRVYVEVSHPASKFPAQRALYAQC